MSITLSLGSQIALSFIAFFIFLAIKDFGKSPLAAYITLTIFMLFAYINIDGAGGMALIYLFFLLITCVIYLYLPVQQEKTNHLYNYGLGFIILFTMFFLQASASGLVVGVPLSIEGFKLVGVTTAGLAENGLFLGLFAVFSPFLSRFVVLLNDRLISRIPLAGVIYTFMLPVIVLIGPTLILAGLFGIFHTTAYAGRVAAILFAASIMTIWIVSYMITKSTTAADISHWGWNFTIYILNEGGVAF